VTLAFGPIYGPEGSLYDAAKATGAYAGRAAGDGAADAPAEGHRLPAPVQATDPTIKPDVVHTHSSKAGIIGRRRGVEACGVPAVVHTIHGLPFHPYQSKLKNRCTSPRSARAARRCHTIVSVADAMTRQALAAGVGRADQYTTIYSGMEVEQYLRWARRSRGDGGAELGIDDDDRGDRHGGAAGGAEGPRRPDRRVAGELAESRAPRLKLLWVGDGWWRDRGMAAARSMGLARPGGDDRAGAAAAVCRDTCGDGCAGAPELSRGAAAHRAAGAAVWVAVVAYDCDGAGEVCIDGQTGRLVPTGDRAALREALRVDAGPPRRTPGDGRGRPGAVHREVRLAGDGEPTRRGLSSLVGRDTA
jgi:hypothetical protein